MFEKDNNLKDTSKNPQKDTHSVLVSYGDHGSYAGAYTKTNKLITALYMVTDMIEKEEPLRNKLRTLGTEVISDTYATPAQAEKTIHEIMSFLEIASAINLISEMNHSILKKEFLELEQSIKKYIQAKQKLLSIEDFLLQPVEESNTRATSFGDNKRLASYNSNGQPRTRIGVQKGSTLMKALSGVATPNNIVNFDSFKKQRRDDIISIIKNNKEGIAIKDIKNIIKDRALVSLLSCSEKTLQRELMSMVKEGILNKTGEKRWSRYFVKN